VHRVIDLATFSALQMIFRGEEKGKKGYALPSIDTDVKEEPNFFITGSGFFFFVLNERAILVV